jgi:hypothetical protein
MAYPPHPVILRGEKRTMTTKRQTELGREIQSLFQKFNIKSLYIEMWDGMIFEHSPEGTRTLVVVKDSTP